MLNEVFLSLRKLQSQDPVNFFDAVKLNGKKFDSDEMREEEGRTLALL